MTGNLITKSLRNADTRTLPLDQLSIVLRIDCFHGGSDIIPVIPVGFKWYSVINLTAVPSLVVPIDHP
jgi:hypothetical protein